MAATAEAAGGQAALFAGEGSARRGAPLPMLQRRGEAVFYELPGGKLASPGAGMMKHTLTVNPYVGCEMSCAYCYAPYAHAWLVERLGAEGRIPNAGADAAFDRAIFVKRNAEEVTRAVLRHPGLPVALGTATDPYQPAERRFRITRGVLEALARLEGIEVSITTKSPLVTRDLDLLERIRTRSRLSVHISLTSVDRALLRVIEPRAPTPERRLEALARLRERGIRAGIFAMPLLPGITDGEAPLDALYAAARAADACFVVAGGVRLSDTSWRRFLPILRALRPDLVEAYQTIIRRRANPQKARYREKLDARIARCKERHGFGGWTAVRDTRPLADAQLVLL
ncbi:MAG: Radical domain protein [Gemmatimonadetes bacterium]|nr:Radical domain protein [Gemmatimonadota bacterium]